MFFQDFIAWVINWYTSRKWHRVLLALVFLGSLLLPVFGLVVFGWSRDTNSLIAEYLVLAEAELKADEVGLNALGDSSEPDAGQDPNDSLARSFETPQPVADSEPGDTQGSGSDDSKSESQNSLFSAMEQATDFAVLLLRRVLKEEEFNSRATFLVAMDLSSKGRDAMARQMMRKIAPQSGNGYRAAHAWLAANRLGVRKQLTEAERTVLLNDLAVASTWAAVSPNIIAIYAGLLANTQKQDEAQKILKQRVDDYPELYVRLAEIAKKCGDEREFRDSVIRAKQYYATRIQNNSATGIDYANFAQVYLLDEEFDNAIKVANAGLVDASRKTTHEDKESKQNALLQNLLRQVLSEGYRLKYRRLLGQVQSGALEMNTEVLAQAIQLLDQALKINPASPQALHDVAEIVATGGRATPEMIEALRNGLADGSALQITHLILANHYLSKNQIDEAIPHLETALRRNPYDAIALNNLAYALLQEGNERLPRALECVDRALQVPGSPTEMRASMFDTKGQILSRLGDLTGAILSFEDAIALQKDKLNTRQRLASAYRTAGMIEMADKQDQKIAELATVQNAEGE